MAAPRAAPPPPAASEVIALARELAALLERETALVRAMKIAEIAPLQPEKTRLTRLFEKSFKSLDAAGTAALSAALRTPWLAAGQRLAGAAVENERALRVGRAATERVIAAIVTAVRQSRRPAAGYSARRVEPRLTRVSGVAFDHRL